MPSRVAAGMLSIFATSDWMSLAMSVIGEFLKMIGGRMIGLVALVCRFTVSPLERWMKRNDETGIHRGLKAPLFIWNRFTVPLEVMRYLLAFLHVSFQAFG